MDKRKILVQLDSDPQPSVFDRVVAVDAGVEELFSYGNVLLDQVRGLVHGAIFTRGPKDLNRTALFIGGSDVGAGEKMLAEAGAKDILLAYNPVGPNIGRVVRFIEKYSETASFCTSIITPVFPVRSSCFHRASARQECIFRDSHQGYQLQFETRQADAGAP